MPVKCSLRFLPAAESDLKEIITFIAMDNPLAAEKPAARFEKSLIQTQEHPLLVKSLRMKYWPKWVTDIS